jgi:hypothetical protein
MNNENTKNAEKFDFDSLFKELKPLEEIELSLPSKSKFYKGAKVFLRPMTFEDEKAITVGKKYREDILKILLSRCLKGINSKDVVLMDKLYLLMKLREISYQEKYPTVLACQSCAKPNNLIFTLDDLNIKYLEDDAEIEPEIELPKTKVKVKIKHPRLEDEVYLNDELKIVDNIWRFIVSINGIEDPTLITKFLKDPRIPIQDVHKLIESIFKSDYGVSMTVKFNCDSCNYQNIDTLPLGSNFFSVS